MNEAELYKRYRPSSLDEVLGQDRAVSILKTWAKKKATPHMVLLTGPSGCGKTTVARILKKTLRCEDGDFQEINCADFRGIDMVRDIRRQISLAPLYGGESRIWLIDEAHKLSNDAQNAMLKMLEDTPDHAYFILCTTDPGKLLKTLITRGAEIRLGALSDEAMKKVLANVLEKEDKEVSTKVWKKIIELAEGSARKALVLLHQVLDLEDEEDQIDALEKTTTSRQSIELARALLNGRPWAEVAPIIKGLDDEPESIRHLILGYAASVVLGGGKMAPNAIRMIDCFRDHFFDSKRAGLVYACWSMYQQD